MRRVDHKYVVERERFERLIAVLAEDHDALEIDGRRRFRYESVYFDTPDLRCFHDHVAGAKPRFKARIRHYVDSDGCVFEVKLKGEDGETDKRQIDYGPTGKGGLTREARGLVASSLADVDLAPPDRLEPALTTSFERVTLAAREGAARVTCDLGVTLTAPDRRRATMRDGLVLLETKSEDGESRADRLLADAGVEPTSLSKYRTGIALLRARDPETEDVRALFERP
jgi:hypothetical protein